MKMWKEKMEDNTKCDVHEKRAKKEQCKCK